MLTNVGLLTALIPSCPFHLSAEPIPVVERTMASFIVHGALGRQAGTDVSTPAQCSQLARGLSVRRDITPSSSAGMNVHLY
ncbi:hypothetical protein F5Y14DRAFT_414950, partial [Nemania sp. NC0429]